jgi:hypothetical protein
MDGMVRDGTATLFGVFPGKWEVAIKYGQVGSESKSPIQLIEVVTGEPETQTFQLAIPEPPSEPPQKAQPEPAQKRPDLGAEKPKPGISFAWVVIWLGAIAGAVALLWLLVRLVKANEKKVAGHLQSLGIQIPEQDDAATSEPDSAAASKPFEAPAIVPEGHCPYCGEPFEADGTCTCQSASSTPIGAISVSATSRPRLVADNGIKLDLPDGTSVIGREQTSAELVLNDPTVSRRHAQVEVSREKVTIRDLGSSNGTFVNGHKVESDVELRLGDTVQIGAVRFRLEA